MNATAVVPPNQVLYQFLKHRPTTIRSTLYFLLGEFLSGLTEVPIDEWLHANDDWLHHDDEWLPSDFMPDRIFSALLRGSIHGQNGATLAIASALDLCFAVSKLDMHAFKVEREDMFGNSERRQADYEESKHSWLTLRQTTLSFDAIRDYFLRASIVKYDRNPGVE